MFPHRASPSSQVADDGTGAVIQNLQDENLALRNTLQQMSLLALPPELTAGSSSEVPSMLSFCTLENLQQAVRLRVLHGSGSLQMGGTQAG